MTRKQLGYTELQWTCKRCGTKNPGLQKTCSNCGGPMAAEDQFELPDQQSLITEPGKLESAKKGPDFHCPYCGARNPGGTEVCIQCGGDLKEALARQAGQVLGAHQAGPAPEMNCPYCASKIMATAQRCPNCGGDLSKKPAASAKAAPAAPKMPVWAIIGIGLLLVTCIGGLIAFTMLGARTNEVRAVVQDVSWQRTIAILEERPAEQAGWESSLPDEAQNVSCEDRYRQTSRDPAPKSTEVCGTPYTLDQGSGVGEVVQDCEYLVYDSYCEYTVYEWEIVTRASAGENDLQPYWPELNLSGSQREGQRIERYLVQFEAGGQYYEYEVDEPATFALFAPGYKWTLEVNSFGAIRAVNP